MKMVKVCHFETPFISGHVKVRHLHPVMPLSVLRFFDRLSLCIPALGKRLAHQLMVIGSLSI